MGRADADAAAPARPLRSALEAAAIATALTIFCAGGFAGLHRMNAWLEAGGHAYIRPETAIDRWIPLCVEWIWPYLSYYPGCFLPVLLLTRMGNLRRIALAYAVQFGVAFACFYAIPMRMGQPDVSAGRGAAWDALRWLYRIDPGYNIFPSLHTANAAMIACAFMRLHPRALGPAAAVWALAIALSTVLVKQHYALDVLAGLALAWLADRTAFRGWREEIERESAHASRTAEEAP
jgi:membrane-associated phospholipid phosphatase